MHSAIQWQVGRQAAWERNNKNKQAGRLQIGICAPKQGLGSEQVNG